MSHCQKLSEISKYFLPKSRIMDHVKSDIIERRKGRCLFSNKIAANSSRAYRHADSDETKTERLVTCPFLTYYHCIEIERKRTRSTLSFPPKSASDGHNLGAFCQRAHRKSRPLKSLRDSRFLVFLHLH